MVQAARSGKQNIIEGSVASATSKETEIKLTSVARASLEELLADYRDFLRTRNLEEWPRDHTYTLRLRKLNQIPNATYEDFRKGIEHPDPAISANVIIGLIQVTNYLLDQQIRSPGGGFPPGRRPAGAHDAGSAQGTGQISLSQASLYGCAASTRAKASRLQGRGGEVCRPGPQLVDLHP